MNKIFKTITTYILGRNIFKILEGRADVSEYKSLSALVKEIRAFAKAVPISIWISLRSDESKLKFKQVLKKHDAKIAKAGLDLGVEFLDKEIGSSYLLNNVEVKAYELSKNIIKIYTDDNPENRAQLNALARAERVPLILASLDQAGFIASKSSKLTDEQKSQVFILMKLLKVAISSEGETSFENVV